jgi:hypothetical protein
MRMEMMDMMKWQWENLRLAFLNLSIFVTASEGEELVIDVRHLRSDSRCPRKNVCIRRVRGIVRGCRIIWAKSRVVRVVGGGSGKKS